RQGALCWGPALESVANSPFQWNETVGELLKYGLVRRSREHQALAMHRLVQTVLKHTIQAVERVFPDGIEPANWPTCKRLLSHAQACAALIEEHDLRSQEAANLLHRMANYLSEHAWYNEAEPLFQRALRIWEQLLGPEHPNVAYPLNDLATLYVEQGKYRQAEPLYQRALRIREQRLGPEHPLTQRVRRDYASFLRVMGREVEARKLEEGS
ncbi:MAG TPA: tetratricopeptide repeat protein, partial [Ktedonobacteraceae bacterium]|nr:tetratricopeptide repeat protein [Ktedonobacteraceae bacterium]